MTARTPEIEMRAALMAIAAMTVDETTDHRKLSALCIAIAQIALAKEAKLAAA